MQDNLDQQYNERLLDNQVADEHSRTDASDLLQIPQEQKIGSIIEMKRQLVTNQHTDKFNRPEFASDPIDDASNGSLPVERPDRYNTPQFNQLAHTSLHRMKPSAGSQSVSSLDGCTTFDIADKRKMMFSLDEFKKQNKPLCRRFCFDLR